MAKSNRIGRRGKPVVNVNVRLDVDVNNALNDVVTDRKSNGGGNSAKEDVIHQCLTTPFFVKIPKR